MRDRAITRILAAAVALAAVGGCSDSSTRPSAEEAFPNEVGTRWVYAVHDSLAQEQDTLQVVITDEVTMQVWGRSERATRWRLTSPGRDEYRYVTFSGDTVRVWGGDETQATYIRFIYVFPLRLGERWQVPPCPGDTARVVSSLTRPVPGHGDRTAYLISRRGGCLNDYLDEDRWFVPGTGLVQGRFHQFGLGPWRNETWTLLSYEPPDGAK